MKSDSEFTPMTDEYMAALRRHVGAPSSSMGAPTPGPWYPSNDTSWVCASSGKPICLVDYALTSKKEAIANAKLLAAAPELAAALMDLRDYAIRDPHGQPISTRKYYAIIEAANAALAKL